MRKEYMDTEPMVKLYVASSWRNVHQPEVVRILRASSFLAYDFRTGSGFKWGHIDPDWKSWTVQQYRKALKHPLAKQGFETDYNGMTWADGCVLVMPAGRSSSIETGWFWGMRRPFWVLSTEPMQPDLMFKQAVKICSSIQELLKSLKSFDWT